MKRVVSSGSSEVVTRNYSYLAGSGSNTSPLVSSLTANHGSTNLFSGNYSYDSVGNITAITGSAPASYTYDSQNQLLTEVRDGTTYTYTYDAAGNLLSKTKLSGSGTDTFTYGNAEWRDLLTAYNGSVITYDTVGNPTTWYDGAAMTWVNGKRLASISATNSHSALAFTYDVDSLRLTKTVGTGSSAVEHKYTWQGGKLIAEYDGTNTLEFFYDESGAPYAFSCNGTIYYYVTNLQGDVVKIVNASGTSQAEYSYNAWGQVISATGTLAAVNPIRYRGYYYDSETGFYYLKSRYYDPEVCRFINADGIISTVQGFLGCNMFAYCLNNPVNMSDAGGCDARPETDFLYTTYFVFATTAATVLTIPGLDTAVTEAARWLEKELRKVSEKIKNLKTQRPPEEHHIVARTAWLAKPARNIINEVLDGGINDPQNLVSVNYLFHRRMHTASYYLIVDALIEGAYLVADGDKEKQKLYVSEMLAFIKTTIQSCGGA